MQNTTKTEAEKPLENQAFSFKKAKAIQTIKQRLESMSINLCILTAVEIKERITNERPYNKELAIQEIIELLEKISPNSCIALAEKIKAAYNEIAEK